jgi:hypothetical protein
MDRTTLEKLRISDLKARCKEVDRPFARVRCALAAHSRLTGPLHLLYHVSPARADGLLEAQEAGACRQAASCGPGERDRRGYALDQPATERAAAAGIIVHPSPTAR